MSCHNCKQWKREHDLAMMELKKHLAMHPPETLVGGIRNLAQAFLSWKETAKKWELKMHELEDQIDDLLTREAREDI